MCLVIRFFLLLCIPVSLLASSQRHKQMLDDFDFICNLFEISYAPLDWKNERFGWSLHEEKHKAKKLITDGSPLTNKQFQQIVRDFCLSTKDYHVTPQFFSTEWATLPFQIQRAEDRYFVSYLDNPISPLSVGDEILLIDGAFINEVVDEFRIKEIGFNHSKTDEAMAAFYLTARFGSFGHDIPQGSVEITYMPAFSDDIQTCTMDWEYHPEAIGEVRSRNLAKSIAPIKQKQSKHKDFIHKKFMTPHCKHVDHFKKIGKEHLGMTGSRKGVLPALGTVLWESKEDSEFHAYLFLMDDWEVGGYVRIPTYYVDGDKAASEFAEVVELFQELSDVMVIDQMNNGGGYLLYLYALAAMLSDYELDLPMHRVKLTQEDVYYAIKRQKTADYIKNDRAARKHYGDTFEGVCVDYQLVTCFQNANKFIIDQWNEGNLYTDYCYLYGMEKIRPHPEVNFTKPILLLTNSLNFSAADFFPAIMQDNKRAKIMGTRTAGAGGYVGSVTFPNLYGIDAIDITASFTKRSNGLPLENTGVTPDVHYEITPADLQNNYSDYKQNILQELRILLSESKMD